MESPGISSPGFYGNLSDRNKIAVQVAAGLFVVFLIYLISLWVLGKGQLVADPNDMRPPKQAVVVLNGYADTTAASDIDYSTVNPASFNFVALRPSYNRKGGAQFSYSMWLKLVDTSASNVAGKTLLLRGDRRVYNWNTEVYNPGTNTTSTGQKWSDVMIKCPRIRFGDTFDSIVIEFNTLADPGASITILPDSELPAVPGNSPQAAPTDPSMRHNALKLIQGRWSLLTFTFEDAVAISDFEGGIMVRFYLNDLLYGTSTMPSAFKQSQGDLFVLPSITKTDPGSKATTTETPIQNGQIGNVTYYNYALGLDEIRGMFHSGPPKKPAKMQNGSMGEPLYLSEFNKLDVYNT